MQCNWYACWDSAMNPDDIKRDFLHKQFESCSTGIQKKFVVSGLRRFWVRYMQESSAQFCTLLIVWVYRSISDVEGICCILKACLFEMNIQKSHSGQQALKCNNFLRMLYQNQVFWMVFFDSLAMLHVLLLCLLYGTTAFTSRFVLSCYSALQIERLLRSLPRWTSIAFNLFGSRKLIQRMISTG